MIVFALVWWCYPIVMACVAVPMAFFWFVENRRDAREEREAGPFPCLAYMGRDVHMGELWCWLQLGHDGDHADQSELPDTAFTREWPDECVDDCTVCNGHLRQSDAAGNVVIDESPGYLPGSTPEPFGFQETGGRSLRPLPALPQRLSKVPAQGNQPWPGCEHQSSDGRCRLVKSHIGPHEYI